MQNLHFNFLIADLVYKKDIDLLRIESIRVVALNV